MLLKINKSLVHPINYIIMNSIKKNVVRDISFLVNTKEILNEIFLKRISN